MNKHYVRIDNKNNVILGFSDAFEQPLQTDIFLHDGGFQFELNGTETPVMITFDGIYLYRYDHEVIPKTEQEIALERSQIVVPDYYPVPEGLKNIISSQEQTISELMDLLFANIPELQNL